ncbi:ABC transporter permease [Amycolatopsis cihanbeyliensis]|uniref:ABC-2 type transport system permease protein n=1 Tax=Amycolatopsis cihanbeyliensis TaxID=1128664 RepID=A0A542DHX9_AMYCI|nr:ABC transporter permease [Amycolatopsis cihanbeyliensis]TQJ02707.1 ABC-2 type transport system permease protein [Amycolatopsis cihanbeyliensis]
MKSHSMVMLRRNFKHVARNPAAVNSDMTKGIINRFKVMDVSRSAILTGRVIASLLTNLVAIAALVGVAYLLGFSPSASFPDWLGVVGIVVLLGFAAGWLTVSLGLAAKSPETAGMASVPLGGAPATGDVLAALAWCAGIALVGYLWASATFTKRA